MSSEADYPLVNGYLYSWSSINITLQNQQYIGIKEVSYKQSKKPTPVRGAHSQKIGRTRGQLEEESAITLFKHSAQIFQDALGDGYLEIPFIVVVQYVEDGSLKMVTDTLSDCIITEIDNSNSEGPDASVVKYSLDPMRIKLNGRNPLKKMLGGNA